MTLQDYIQEVKKDITDQEWRSYHLGNYYMSSIQQGIQAAHAQMELFNKYGSIKIKSPTKDHMQKLGYLYTWSINHKTMICLNGGANKELNQAWEIVDNENNPYPYSVFTESKDAMNGMLTNVCFVIPSRIFQTSSFLRKKEIFIENNIVKSIENNEQIIPLSQIEVDIINLITYLPKAS